MTTPTDPQALGKLRQLAEKATKGPWMNESHEGDRTVTPAWLCQHERWPIASGIGPDCPDMAFIAAANPQAILALLDRLEKAEGDLAECYRLSGADPDGNEDWRLARDAVAEVRRLRNEYDNSEQCVWHKIQDKLDMRAEMTALEARLAGAERVVSAARQLVAARYDEETPHTHLWLYYGPLESALAALPTDARTDLGQQMGEG